MKLKINWGWGIVIFLFIFVGSVALRVYIAAKQKINLVTPDYYPKGIAYEQEINKIAHYENLKEKMLIKQNDQNLIITFPPTEKMGDIKGRILVYRPSDYEEDSLFTILLTDSLREFFIPKDFMKAGLYKLKVDWAEDSIAYFVEKRIFIKK